ncbi:MAG: hypothetical protein HY238_15795 [Acidobacteria bacterium]|nr:hypothetical protein [Acidobacteriota bacterium]
MLVCSLVLASPLAAQKRVSSEKKTSPELGDKPNSVLKIENLKGTLKSVDLQKRTVTVSHSDGEMVLSFPTAAGREKITLSKKVAAAMGKKSLHLEEIRAGSRVKVAYYPALGAIMEITVEELAR